MATLGERAVDCPAFRWLPGMLTVDGQRVLRGVEDAGYVLVAVRGWLHVTEMQGDRPPLDLTDAATIGCLAWLIADVHGGICVMEHRIHDPMKGWIVWQYDSDGSRRAIARAADRTETLVLALEAAP